MVPKWLLLGNATAAFALNLAVYLLIGKTSALTMNIAGTPALWRCLTRCRPVGHARSVGHLALRAIAVFSRSLIKQQCDTWAETSPRPVRAGVVKDWLLIGLSAMLYSAPVTKLNLIGYGIAFLAVLWCVRACVLPAPSSFTIWASNTAFHSAQDGSHYLRSSVATLCRMPELCCEAKRHILM